MGSRRIRLIAAGVGFLLLLGVTLVVTTGPDDVKPEAEIRAREALPTVDPDAVQSLEIRAPDRPTVVLRRGAEGWRVAEPIEGDANDNYVTLALRKLGELPDLHRGVAATKADNHERLQVSEDSGVEVIARGDDVLAHVFVGVSKHGATMLRVAGDDTVHSLKGSLKAPFDRELRDWRERKIVDESPDDVREAVFTNAEGSFHFTRNEDEGWSLWEAEPAIEELDPSRVQSAVSTLSRMRAADFADSATGRQEAGIGPEASTAKLILEDEEIVLRLGHAVDDGESQFYLVREGREPIYVISKFVAERIGPKAEQFEEGSEPDTEEDAPSRGDLPEGMTQEQLDDLMKQIQQQPIKMR